MDTRAPVPNALQLELELTPPDPRRVLGDTLGLSRAVVITAASVQDHNGGRKAPEQAPVEQYPGLLTAFTDAGYPGRLDDIAAEEQALALAVVPKLEGRSTFRELPQRWVVERPLARLVRYRRLRADYEVGTTSSWARILIAAIHRRARLHAR